MSFHIDTALIKDKLKEADCPLCAIRKVIEEQFLHEFLNDAVMEDDTRIKVGKKGFCERHFDMLFERQNKLSLALQIDTRVDKLLDEVEQIKNLKSAKKQAEFLEKSLSTCAVCDYADESMEKYYDAFARLFLKEEDFCALLLNSNGFCLPHYQKLLQHAKSAGKLSDSYIETISGLTVRKLKQTSQTVKEFCKKHDYRNALLPLGESANALLKIRTKLYGEFDKEK